MNAQIAVLVLEALVKFGPAAARAITDLFRKDTISSDDWNKVFDLAEKSYESYIAPKVTL
jgi:hypothetical protein